MIEQCEIVEVSLGLLMNGDTKNPSPPIPHPSEPAYTPEVQDWLVMIEGLHGLSRAKNISDKPFRRNQLIIDEIMAKTPEFRQWCIEYLENKQRRRRELFDQAPEYLEKMLLNYLIEANKGYNPSTKA